MAKGTLPKMSGSAGRLFRRSMFLEGKERCYYGPKQNPDAGELDAYPGEWPKAGSLLRIPQVVWISGVGGKELLADQSCISHPAYYPNGQVITECVPNEDRTSWLNFQSAAASACTAIKSLRGERTWCYVPDWINFESASPTDPPFLPFDSSVPANSSTVSRYVLTSGPACLRAPRAAEPGGYFGTDFLHVYIGQFIWNAGGEWSFDPDDTTPPGQADPFGIQAGVDNISAQSKRFAGYAIRCYGYSQSWGQYTGDPYYTDHWNALHNDQAPTSNQHLQECCDRAASASASADVKYVGDGTGLTAQDLVSLIAGHFKFDPATGRDLE